MHKKTETIGYYISCSTKAMLSSPASGGKKNSHVSHTCGHPGSRERREVSMLIGVLRYLWKIQFKGVLSSKADSNNVPCRVECLGS